MSRSCRLWRRLSPSELDHETLWLGVSVASLCVAVAWLLLDLPTPTCAFHRWTGLPCPGCGATRCLRWLIHGHWRAALAVNPAVFFGFAATALFDIYAIVVVSFSLPRFRPERFPAWVGGAARTGTVVALLANWAWLIWRHV